MITPTHINYFHLCHRKLWLFSHGIRMEHTSDIVYEGKMIHEESYPRRPAKYTEVDLGEAVIDFYDARQKVIHEIKKSDKVENAHIAQVKYYLWLFKKRGIEGVTGIIEYPKLKQTEKVILEQEDETAIQSWLKDIRKIIDHQQAPGVINSKICKSCSYYDYCYV
jgi:CRISPR-associated exonuclease Cas4